MLAVGEHLFGDVDDQTLRLMAALGGSVGLIIQEPCGALTSGVLMIGAHHKHTVSADDADQSEKRATRFRQKFLEEFGSINCQDIRDQGFGSNGNGPCTELVERAIGILLQTLS